MVDVVEISKEEFLAKYVRRAIENPINVTIDREDRVYGYTTEEQALNPDGYIVVYCKL